MDKAAFQESGRKTVKNKVRCMGRSVDPVDMKNSVGMIYFPEQASALAQGDMEQGAVLLQLQPGFHQLGNVSGYFHENRDIASGTGDPACSDIRHSQRPSLSEIL